MSLAIVPDPDAPPARPAARLAGPLDRETSPSLERWLDGHLARDDVRAILLDLSGLTALTAAGAGVFLGRAPMGEERGVRLLLYGLPAPLAAKAALYGLPDLVGLHPDRPAADALCPP